MCSKTQLQVPCQRVSDVIQFLGIRRRGGIGRHRIPKMLFIAIQLKFPVAESFLVASKNSLPVAGFARSSRAVFYSSLHHPVLPCPELPCPDLPCLALSYPALPAISSLLVLPDCYFGCRTRVILLLPLPAQSAFFCHSIQSISNLSSCEIPSYPLNPQWSNSRLASQTIYQGMYGYQEIQKP